MAEGDPSEEEEEVHASSSEQPSGGRRSKGRKGKKSNKSGGGGRDKKRRSKENLNEIASIANSADSQREEKVLGVFIHYSDCLNLDVHLWHPIIKVLIVDLETGHFVEKQDKDKAVTCYEEANVRHILPLMTQPFMFRKSPTLVPRWEELLLFNESFSYLSGQQQRQQQQHGATSGRRKGATREREKLGLFFLVQDFVSMSRANNSASSSGGGVGAGKNSGDGRGWHDVAWAFLKPFPSPGVSNTETKLRLQLYRPNARRMPAGTPKGAREDEAQVVWNWWMNCKHVKYPSSLYVTVQAIVPPKEGEQGKSAKPEVLSASQREGGPGHLLVSEDCPLLTNAPKVPVWSRTPGTKCEVPKAKVAELECTGRGGVYCLKFSRCGRHLAAGCPAGSGSSAIFVYDATSMGEAPAPAPLMTFGGHSGPVYELDWHDHRTLLSASGDGTAQVWHLGRGRREVMEHPTFVYCARFHPGTQHVVVTGGYDRVIRVWKWNEEDERYSVQQELTAHEKGYVTALEFDADGHNLFSGDHAGCVKIWEIYGGNTASDFQNNPDSLFFRLKKELKLPDLEGYSVESLRLHPGGIRLLVHSTSLVSALVMVDLRHETVMQEYHLDKEVGRRVGNCISPCGDLVFAGGQGGVVYAWDTDNGVQRHVYPPEDEEEAKTVHAICYHPHDHIVVFGALDATSALGRRRRSPPAVVYKYRAEEDKLEQQERRLKL